MIFRKIRSVPERHFHDRHFELPLCSVHQIFKKLWSILANFLYMPFIDKENFTNIDHNFFHI